MCRTEIFPEESKQCSCLSHDDKPLTMKELNVAKIFDFDFKYGKKTAWELNDDLASISLSMKYSPNRHRKKKRRKYPKFRFVPSLGDIKENELFDAQLENLNKHRKDLAAIHEERALNCGMSVKKDESRRRHRHKRHSRGS